MRWADRATDLGFGLGWSAARALPESVVERAFRAAADRSWRSQGQSVRQLRANLSRVLPDERLPELDDITREGLRRYMRYWGEAFRLPEWSPQRIDDSFALIDPPQTLDNAMKAGKGAVFALTHSGNWDLAGAWASQRYGGLVTVAERLKPERLFTRFVEYREGLGMEVLPLGNPDVVRVMARRLQEGKMVCLLADRDLTQGGVPVQFFGERASMPGGPALLSMLTGAPLIPASVWHTDTGAVARIGLPIEIPREGPRAERVAIATQALADSFAIDVAEHPEDWHMMQRLWAADLGEAAS